MSSKNTFDSYYQKLLSKSDFNKLTKIYHSPARKALQLNSLYYNQNTFKQFVRKNRITLEPVHWSANGYFYNDHRGQSLGNYPEFAEGMYYLQDATSMLPPEMLQPQADDFVLDLCASPGGKTIHLSNLMQGRGLIIANEVEQSRMIFLSKQLAKYGTRNVVVTSCDSSYFAKFLPNFFAKILLDAPCSGEGIRARNQNVRKNFSYNRIRFNAKRQKRLIHNAYLSLKKGGIMVYATCALSYEENEEVVAHLCQKFPDARIVDTKINYPGISYQNHDLKKCIRIWPFYFDTNGFFVAKIKKTKISKISSSSEKSHASVFAPNWKTLSLSQSSQYFKEFCNFQSLKNILDQFEFYRFKNEIWLIPFCLKKVPLPYINYAGIKIATINQGQVNLVITEEKLAKICDWKSNKI